MAPGPRVGKESGSMQRPKRLRPGDTFAVVSLSWGGQVSFYGPSVMGEFGEYVEMPGYTRKAVSDILFGAWERYSLPPSGEWTDSHIPWGEENIHTPYAMKKDLRGYEVLNGAGKARGHLLGGCLDGFMMLSGTRLWPPLQAWKGAILFVETSEEKPSPDFVKRTFRNLAAQGILKVLHGIIVAKPQDEVYYEQYKASILQVAVPEEALRDLPIFYNVNFGHAKPIGIIPYGIQAELNCGRRTITFLECPTV